MSDDLDPIADFDDRLEWSHELHRAIGRCVVRFEWLMDAMRGAIASMVWRDPTTPPTLVRTVLGDAQPAALLTRFQAVLAQLNWFDAEERRIINNVCHRIQGVIEKRNTVVHGMWFSDPEMRIVNGTVLVSKMRYTKAGLKPVNATRTAEEIHEIADEAEYLRKLVSVIELCEDQEPMGEWLVWDDQGNVRLPFGDG